MSDTDTGTGTPAAAGPVLLEHGRYAIRQPSDGGLVIGRAVGICQRCQDCGCGDQAELIHVPAMILKIASGSGGGMMLRKLRAMIGQPEDTDD